MIISVQGNLIDTKLIYQITPVEMKTFSGSFTIRLFDKKDLDIHADIFSLFEVNTLPSDEEKVKKITDELSKSLEVIKDFVVKHWKESPSDIPGISLIPRSLSEL